jgi:hypothetical protein
VLDTETKLIWSIATSKARDWNHADEIAKSTTVAGLSGRLPTIAELLTLVDYWHHDPAIDMDFFPECPTYDWYWTSTPYAPWPGHFAWSVGFSSGYTSRLSRYYSGYVRAVRARRP